MKKFEFISEKVRSNIDVLMVSENQIDDSFLTGNVLIHGFSSQYRLDPVLKSGRIILNKMEDALSSLFATDKKTYKIFLILVNVQNEKYWQH